MEGTRSKAEGTRNKEQGTRKVHGTKSQEDKSSKTKARKAFPWFNFYKILRSGLE